LATALYEDVFQRLRERGCDRVEAATATVNNHALQFHRKLGFCVGAPESVVDELGGQREAVKMWRDLGAPIRGWRAGFRSHWPASRQDHPHQR
jgi:GNAT superfamily N-acetyltransferase